MPSKGMGSKTQAEAKLNAAFKAVGRRRGDDSAYALPQIEKAMKVYYKDLKIGALKKPASMTKGSLVKKAAPKKAVLPRNDTPVTKRVTDARKKASAAKKPGMTNNGPRRRAI